jgi:hypothetical protein
MTCSTRLSSPRMFLATLFLLAIWVSAPTHAEAQSAGNNAVYPVFPGACCTHSSAFIDASVFGGSGTNICGVLNGILGSTSYPAGGAVIDARGLPGVGTSMTCTTTGPSSPWGSGGSYLNVPSTILLPDTTASPIVIPTPWILPNNTRLIGQGDNDPASGTPQTTIRATSSFSGNMIQFGSTICPLLSEVPACSGISVENLTLNGHGGSINGIVNQYAQDFSYVDHVSLYQILGAGLSVSGNANNSGPYSNITFDTGGLSGASSTICPV